MNQQPIKLFISYAHVDEEYKDELTIHLKMLERNGFISGWNDRQLIGGQEWDDEIKQALIKYREDKGLVAIFEIDEEVMDLLGIQPN